MALAGLPNLPGCSRDEAGCLKRARGAEAPRGMNGQESIQPLLLRYPSQARPLAEFQRTYRKRGRLPEIRPGTVDILRLRLTEICRSFLQFRTALGWCQYLS